MPFIYSYEYYLNDEDFHDFSNYCKSDTNEIFKKHSKFKLNALLNSSVVSPSVPGDKRSSKNKIVKAIDLKDYLMKYYKIIFVPTTVREEIIHIWESERASEATEVAFQEDTPNGLGVKRQSTYNKNETLGNPDLVHQNSVPVKLVEYSAKGKKKANAIIAAHKPKIEAQFNDIYEQSNSSVGKEGTDSDYNGFNQVQNLASIKDKIRQGEMAVKDSYDKQKLSTIDNSNFAYQNEFSLGGNNFEEGSMTGSKTEGYRIIIERHFGTKLLEYFEKYFDRARIAKKYTCDSKNCRVDHLLYNVEKNKSAWSDAEDNVPDLNTSFRHSFIYKCKKSDESNKECDAETYLKEFMRSNINLKSLYDYYNNQYYDEGILNMYMRVLDVYNGYLYSKNTIEYPDTHFKKVKVFDTVSVRNIIEDQRTGGINDKIDEELSDFFDYDILVIPIFRKELNQCCLVVILLTSECNKVELYDRNRENEYSFEDLENLNEVIS